MKPAPTPSNVRPRDAKKYKDMVIEHEVTAGETFTACSASEALQVLFPKQFKTATAAKKACRCEHVQTECSLHECAEVT